MANPTAVVSIDGVRVNHSSIAGEMVNIWAVIESAVHSAMHSAAHSAKSPTALNNSITNEMLPTTLPEPEATAFD